MEQLARLRELKGYSQRALAKESGVSPATIYELENGRRRPNPSTLRKLARALEVEVADLLGGEYPKSAALPSQDRLFNGGAKERGAFIERCRRHVAARVAHYENRLAVAKRGGLFGGYQGALALQDDAWEECSQLFEAQNGELIERWHEDPEVTEAAKEELGFELTEAQRPFVRIVGRIGDLVNEIAESQAEKDLAAQQHDKIREWTSQIDLGRHTA